MNTPSTRITLLRIRIKGKRANLPEGLGQLRQLADQRSLNLPDLPRRNDGPTRDDLKACANEFWRMGYPVEFRGPFITIYESLDQDAVAQQVLHSDRRNKKAQGLLTYSLAALVIGALAFGHICRGDTLPSPYSPRYFVAVVV